MDLYRLHQRAIDSIQPSDSCFNWHIDFQCKPSDLAELAIGDVAQEAAEWRAEQPAPGMYFTHRQFYRDGVQHIIDELKAKPTSNRALYSLLSQSEISGSFDKPIPSFLSFQCSIEKGNHLYCTATFRALEVARFFRVNLEEIRQTLAEICESLQTIETIHLHIFAFHAYCDSQATSLRRPKIELVNDETLLLMMQDDKATDLDLLLRGLRKSTTVVSSVKLKTLKRILERDSRESRLGRQLSVKQALLVERLDEAIHASDELNRLRQSASRGRNTSAAIQRFQVAIDNLCTALLN